MDEREVVATPVPLNRSQQSDRLASDENKFRHPVRQKCFAVEEKRVYSSLETVGVVRDNAVVSMGRCNTHLEPALH